MEETLSEISKAVSAISRIDAVPTLLAVLRETTGMRFAAVVRATDQLWTVCAVQDFLKFDIEVGDPLILEPMVPFESPSALETRGPCVTRPSHVASPY